MSGPKDYSPPPRYSMQVFNGKLNQVFQIQARLKMLCDEISNSQINDNNLNIRLDCRDDFNQIKKQVETAGKPLVFDYRGTFGQDVYNRISREIDAKISELNKTLGACESVKINFSAKRKDYETYLAYRNFHDYSKASFEDFRAQILDYLKNNLETKAPEIFDEAREKMSRINFEKERSAFSVGFTGKNETEKTAVMNHLVKKENEINSVRAEISNKVIDKFQESALDTHRPHDSEKSEELDEISEKIESLLRSWEDGLLRKDYTKTFRKLKESQSLSDVYFFKELHDSIIEEQNSGKIKNKFARLLNSLNDIKFHSSIQPERQSLVSSCLKFMNASASETADFQNLQSRFEKLKETSDFQFREDEVKRKEHLFLKSQIVVCLENLGYEVMDDLEVIDFEKENDFLLKIPRQENYLNLKFKTDGSMRYVFQMPEKQNELSTDEEKMKLHEMQVTCDEFKSVLEDLSKMGLKVNLRSDRPIEADSLVSVPESKRPKIKQKTDRKEQKQTLRKKYLNQ